MISVILPVYNGDAFIRDTIRSILDQTEANFELIIIDDGSTDQTEDIIQSFVDNRINYIKQVNKGVANAKNEGIKHSTGDFILFHDTDDLSVINRFQKLLNGFYSKEIGFVHSDILLINENNHSIGYWQTNQISQKEVFSFFIHVGTPYNNGTIMYRREVLENKQFEDFKIGEDTEFVMRIAMEVESYHIAEPLYMYRRHSKSATNNFHDDDLAEHVNKVLERKEYRKHLKEIDWFSDAEEKNTLKVKLIIATALSKRGMMAETYKLFAEAIPHIRDAYDRSFFEGMKALVESRYNDARDIFLNMESEDAIVKNYLGEAYLYLKQYEKSYEHFINALNKRPDYVMPIQNLKAIGQLTGHHLVDMYKERFR